MTLAETQAESPRGPFPMALAEGDHWRELARELGRGLAETGLAAGAATADAGRLGFLYVTDTVARDLGGLLTNLRRTTGIEDWIGSVGIGVAATGRAVFDRPAAAAMVADLPEGSVRLLPPVVDDGPLPDAVATWVDRVAPPFAIVHADPATPDLPGLVQALSARAAPFLVGGLMCSRGPQQQVAGVLTDGGVTGALFAPEVEVATALTQGCTPLGPARLVTESIDNVVMTLDGEAALEVFKRDIGELLARDLRRVAGYVHAAFPVEGSDTGDYMVRNLVAVDPEHGWLAVGGPAPAVSRLMFVRRDPTSAAQDLTAALGRLKARLPSPPRGGVYFSCVARGPAMFGDDDREMALVREALGDVPLVGFYANGEISHDRLYGYTGVVALFL